jgi:hypothetical protein
MNEAIEAGARNLLLNCAGAKAGPSTRQHEHTYLVVAPSLFDGSRERLEHLSRHRIELRRVVESDRRDVSVSLVRQVVVRVTRFIGASVIVTHVFSIERRLRPLSIG